MTRARRLAEGKPQSVEDLKKMRSFFARHSAYKSSHADKTSKAYQSWLLWGGNAGERWASSQLKKLGE